MLRVEVVNTVAGLEKYADAWNSLAESAPQPRLMDSHACVASFVEHCLKPEQDFRCFLAFDGSELAGVLPLIVIPYRMLGFRRPKLCPPHSWIGFCLKPGCENAVIQCILDAVSREFPNRFRLEIKRISPTSQVVTVLKNGITGNTCFIGTDAHNSYIKTVGDFEAYKSTLKKNFRMRLHRSQNKLARLPNVTVDVITDDVVSEEHLKRFMDLEASGWKGRSGIAIKSSPVNTALHKTLVHRLARQGWLEWHWLKTDGKVIAGLLMLKVSGIQRAHKIAYDEDYRAYSPGTMLLFKAIERAFSSSEINEINFLGDAKWLGNWQFEKRVHYMAALFPRRPLSLLCGYSLKVIGRAMQRIPVLRKAVKWLISAYRNKTSTPRTVHKNRTFPSHNRLPDKSNT